MHNILEECSYCDIDLLKINDSIRQELEKNYDIDADCTVLRLCESDILKYNIPEEAIDFDSFEFDEYELESILIDNIGKFPYYLVFANGCTWNGDSGYTFCNDIIKTVYRPYDISLSIIENIKNGILCMESSHDVPTGSKTYIIGLSEEEYEKLEDSDFNDIKDFVESH